MKVQLVLIIPTSLLLAWNFLEYFSTKYAAFLKNGGRFILPHPSVVCYPE